MAFIDTDTGGDPFVNVTHRVGKTGDWDDLLAVQLMLQLVYANSTPLKKTKPTKGPVTVTGKPAADTPVLIAHFQKVSMKRSKPQGFINKAVGTARAKEETTIWMLNVMTSTMLACTGSSDTVISYLKKKAPQLASSLKTDAEQAAEYQENFPQPIIHPSVY
jgi:hypothetical protein